MKKYILGGGILMIFCILQNSLFAQQPAIEMSYYHSLQMLYEKNPDIKIAHKELEWTRTEHQRLNAFWYPSLNASGAYVHLSNQIEVKEPLSQFTDPAKESVHHLIPNDQLISSILDQIGAHSLTFPLMNRKLTTIDANFTWALFTGGKRIFANRVGKRLVEISKLNKEQLSAELQSKLVMCYYGLRLGHQLVEVREDSYNSLLKHYDNALKLETNGMINKADRLFVQVNLDEAKRELTEAHNNVTIAQQALKALINPQGDEDIVPTSTLFINHELPSLAYFKGLMGQRNYLVNSLELQKQIADNQLYIARSGYVPNMALFAKQTLYARGIPKNLVPRTMVGVGFTWNLFDGLDREKRIRQAKIEQETIGLSREKAMNDLSVAVDECYMQAQNALNNVSALRATIALSEELVRMRVKSFQEGMATSTEVVDAQVMLSSVKVVSLMAYYQYDMALIHLLAMCGIPETFIQYSTDTSVQND